MSNHFIYALCDLLSQLFTAMLRHGIIPDSIRDCILVPIPKRDPSSLNSYHPIALAPSLSKVFEWCLLFDYILTTNLAVHLIFVLVCSRM